MLDEKALRKPSFDQANSRLVVLADGQSWFFPKPFVRLKRRPVFKAGKADRVCVVTDDPEFDTLLNAAEADNMMCDWASLAAFLLTRNYDLTDDQLGELLEYDPDQTAENKWLPGLMEVAYGRTGKKTSGGGST